MRHVIRTGAVLAGLAASIIAMPAADAGTRTLARADADDVPSLVARGKVKTAAGKAAASTPVALYAWPSNDVTDKMVVGDQGKLQELALTSTASDGSFELTMTDLSQLDPVAGSDGIVNFEVVAGEGGSAAPFAFARKVVTTGAGKILVDAVSDDRSGRPEPPPSLTIDLTNRQITDQTEQNTASVDPAVFDAPDEPGFAKACTYFLQEDLGPQWAVVGQHYSRTTQVSTDFLYIKSNSSELGVGFSADGKFGSWKASGTIAKSTTASIDYPAVGDYRGVYRMSMFKYAKYMVACSTPGGIPVPWYQVNATSWAGGSKTVNATGPTNQNYCVPNEQGSVYVVDTSKAVTWTNGADTSAAIGADLSIRTGYSIGARLQFGFNRARRLCGSTGYPGDTPSQLTSW